MDHRHFLAILGAAPLEQPVRRVYSFLWSNPLAVVEHTIYTLISTCVSSAETERLLIEGYDQFGRKFATVATVGLEPVLVPWLTGIRVTRASETEGATVLSRPPGKL